jgi:tRNA-dihydrouridine synthase A
MIDWTDRHCRYFHRLMTKKAVLYSEMIVADAILNGDPDTLLQDGTSGPVALQLGGSDPDKLFAAVQIAKEYHYSEINLNVGCPSDRVQSGTFGACLMRSPDLVGECVAALKQASDLPVTVKCRIGVDEQDVVIALDQLAHAVWEKGCDALWVHARKAWLEGLSPKQNREIPPLDYDRVRRLKRENPQYFIGLNGGLANLNQALEEMNQAPDMLNGVMMGRAAYQNPDLLRRVDQEFYGCETEAISYDKIIQHMIAYCDNHLVSGGKMHHVTRHMTGLFHGLAGARRWRQLLSTRSVKETAIPQLLLEAYACVADQNDLAA